MATYVNNLRLTELATGEGSGTWGTTTNTNLELIGEALGYGSEAIANASTHTITVADGTADSARSFYLKLTGGGQACTVTLAPNTLSKVWMVENTTNSTLTFSQGSGANVAVPAGQVKMIATDGAGSGAVVYDLLVDTDLTGTTTVVNLTASGTVDAATVEFDSLSGTGAVAVTDILDQDDMSSNSATALATQQSIKAYVDSSVASFDTLAEVLAQGNTTGGTDIVMSAGDNITNASGDLTIDVAGDIILDADGADIIFKDGGTTFLEIDKDGNNARIKNPISDGDVLIQGSDGGSIVTALSLDMSAAGAATFNAGITASNAGVIKALRSDNARSLLLYTDNNAATVESDTDPLLLISPATITLDAAQDIKLDADSSNIYLADGGTDIGLLSVNSQDLNIRNLISDKDIYFQGNDGGSNFTALTLDMSAAGAATFNNNIVAANGKVIVGSTSSVFTNSIISATNSTGPVIGAQSTSAAHYAGGFHNTASGAVDLVAFYTGSGALAGSIETGSSGEFIIESSISDKDLVFKGNDGGSATTALTLDMSAAGAATFNSTGTFAGGNTNFDNDADVVTLNGSLHTRLLIDTSSTGGHQAAIVLESNGNQSIIGNTGSNTSFAVAAGNLTLDVAGNIILDADGGEIEFKDGGTTFGNIAKSSNDMRINQGIQDGDIVLRGNDGGSIITALTLDMSEAGAATFNSTVTSTAFGSQLATTLFEQNVLKSSVASSAGAFIRMAVSGASNPTYAFEDDTNTGMFTSGADTLNFSTAGTERLTIASNGAALFSSTVNSGASNVVGIDGTPADVNAAELGMGYLNLSRDDVANRKMIQFGSGGALLGSIFSGHNGSQVGIGVSTTGITFNPSTRSMMPADPTSASPQLDATLDIGFPSVRWKDAYLSGGVYLGGTGAANKLDDYEEGTWTPVITGTTGAPTVGYTNQGGRYIKVGNSITIFFGVRLSSISGGSGTVRITGLPFASGSYGAYQNPFGIATGQVLTTSQEGPVLMYVEDNNSSLQGRYLNTNSDAPLPLSLFQGGSYLVCTFTYDL